MKSVLCRLVKALSIKKLLSVVKFRPGNNSNWENISQFEFFPGLNLTTENNYPHRLSKSRFEIVFEIAIRNSMTYLTEFRVYIYLVYL